MDYKVILYNINDATDVDNAGNFEFYTHEEAELCCQRWVDINSTKKAYFWNGAVWRLFT